jgi:hypothetical protein
MYKQDPEKFINSFMDGLNEANRRQKAYLEELNKEKLPVFFARCCASGEVNCDAAHRHEFMEGVSCIDCPHCQKPFSIVYYYERHNRYCNQFQSDRQYFYDRPDSRYGPEYLQRNYDVLSQRDRDYRRYQEIENYGISRDSRLFQYQENIRKGTINYRERSKPPVSEPEIETISKGCNHEYYDTDCLYCYEYKNLCE